MTAKEYLQNAYKIERRVKIIENKVKKLRSQLEYAGISYEIQVLVMAVAMVIRCLAP